ncbi:MAG: hypothetical protein GTO03_02725, partial [Planctomycetales bacterium]|nr:hypothetical protein [Planctomycetales bacterium]
ELTLDDEPGGGSDVPLAQSPGEAEGDSVLLSERELGGSDVTPKSTIIDDASESGQDSDITLAQEEQPGEASDVQLVGDSMIKGSDIGLADSQLDL